MAFKDKFLIVFLTIITFGLIWLHWNKKKSQKKDHLSVSYKIPFEINDLYQNVGSIDNIQNCSFTHNKLRIDLLNVKLVNQQALLKLKGISGVVLSSNSINLIVGNIAKAIAEKIIEQKG